MSRERLTASKRFAVESLEIPEKGLLFSPEKYKIVDVFVTKVRQNALSRPDKVIQAALIMPKAPGEGSRSTGFHMSLTKIQEDGKLSVLAGNTVDILSRGTDGLRAGGLTDIFLFNDQDRTNTFYRKMGYSKRIDALQNIVGRHLGMLYMGVEFKKQEELEESAREIAPKLMSFFDLYPDVVTPFYIKHTMDHNLRVFGLRLKR